MKSEVEKYQELKGTLKARIKEIALVGCAVEGEKGVNIYPVRLLIDNFRSDWDITYNRVTKRLDIIVDVQSPWEDDDYREVVMIPLEVYIEAFARKCIGRVYSQQTLIRWPYQNQ